MFGTIRAFVGALTAAAVASFAAPASAGIWSSDFDPITFSGNGVFQFNDACLAGGTFSGSSCNLQLLSASVNMTAPGGSSAHLDFGPQAIQGLPAATVVQGDQFPVVLTETSGSVPGATFNVKVTIGADLGGGLFGVSDLTIVSSSIPVNPFLTEDLSGLTFDSADFHLSGDVTGTSLGGGGGTHHFVLSFTDPQGTWEFDDTNAAVPPQTTTTTGTYQTTVSLDIQGGALTGIDSGLLGPAFVTDDSSSLFGPWWLQWQTSAGDPVLLFTGNCFEGCLPNQTPSGTALHVTFTEVSGPGAPEPGTFGLIVGGVGAAWLARRRKRAA